MYRGMILRLTLIFKRLCWNKKYLKSNLVREKKNIHRTRIISNLLPIGEFSFSTLEWLLLGYSFLLSLSLFPDKILGKQIPRNEGILFSGLSGIVLRAGWWRRERTHNPIGLWAITQSAVMRRHIRREENGAVNYILSSCSLGHKLSLRTAEWWFFSATASRHLAHSLGLECNSSNVVGVRYCNWLLSPMVQ